MYRRISTIAVALALPILLLASGTAYGQEEGDRDTDRAHRRMEMRHHRGAGMQGQGMRFGAGGFVGANHVGPRMLLNIKDELGLSEEQAAQLEKIHEEHHALMTAQMEKLSELRESMQAARLERDWDALDAGIDEGSTLRTGVAKGLLEVERRSLAVLNEEQAAKLESWQEGLRVFRHQRMEMRHEMGQGMRRGMRMRHHAPADTAKSN
jgi:Spy/CpxP family protein refolding chaperone